MPGFVSEVEIQTNLSGVPTMRFHGMLALLRDASMAPGTPKEGVRETLMNFQEDLTILFGS